MDTLIEAASMISRDFPGLSVAIAGGGRDRHRLERLASRASVRVDFLGRVADSDLPDFYACADVFALCCRSRWWGLEQEGFGVVLVEAAAAGIPCITIDSGGAGEAVRDGETGIVAKLGAPDDEPSNGRQRAAQVAEIAEALTKLLGNPELARRMGEAGRRRAEEELSYDALASKLGDAIAGLAAISTGSTAGTPTEVLAEARLTAAGAASDDLPGGTAARAETGSAEPATPVDSQTALIAPAGEPGHDPPGNEGRHPGRAAWHRLKHRREESSD